MTIKGRVMVAISYNSDLGDAWEWADSIRTIRRRSRRSAMRHRRELRDLRDDALKVERGQTALSTQRRNL